MDSSGDKMSLDKAMNELGESIAWAREALAKSTSTLEAVHREVLPQNPLPRDADGFLGVLGPGSSTMASFARALTVRGSESTFKMILAHRIPGDFASAVADLPKHSNGRPISLKPVVEQAAQLAKAFMATTERLTAEASHRTTRGVSESASER